MKLPRSGAYLLRPRSDHDDRVSFVELFFDLVFVFAITRLSHSLLEDFTLAGAARTAMLLLAVWWVWVYTAWAINWLDPHKTAVRLMLFVLMLLGLVMSASIPDAFGARGLSFALTYVAMQVGRCVFLLWALADHQPNNFRNFQRITSWLAFAGVFWIAGGFADGEVRIALWIAALAIEYCSPAAGFWTPGLGRSTTADWDISGEHMAERCGLFVIISLGESVLVTGASFGDLEWSAVTMAAFAVAFVSSVAMWWVYFHIGAERGSRFMADSEDPGRLARAGYTYVHILVVAGIVVAAVADEFLLLHPEGHIETGIAAVIVGGPALFLLGTAVFKWLTGPHFPLSHIGGLVLFAGLAWLAVGSGLDPAPLSLGAAAALVLVIVAVWERISLSSEHRRITH